jgi:transposase
VDLETGEPVDLLEDRRAETLAHWLEQHPGVELITRDRSGPYKEGAQQGAPEALQVADRWHLLQNLWEALEGMLAREHRALHAAARPLVAEPAEPSPEPAPPSAPAEAVNAAPPPPSLRPRTRAERQSEVRRARRVALYEEVHRLYAEGYSVRAIAYKTGKHRHTVRSSLEAKTFPERKPRAPSSSKPGILAAYEAYLVRRWREGCHHGNQLWRELCEQGFEGSCSTVKDRVEAWRRQLPPEERRRSAERADKASKTRTPAPRTVVWWLMGSQETLTQEQIAFLGRLKQECPPIEVAERLAVEVLTLTRRREAEKLEEWTQRAVASGIGELKRFCTGLERDWAAVKAGLSLPWSNGPVEGHVNRLKAVKRPMYGRAGFALLRARVLPLPEAA